MRQAKTNFPPVVGTGPKRLASLSVICGAFCFELAGVDRLRRFLDAAIFVR
jgi:hypothetical protein